MGGGEEGSLVVVVEWAGEQEGERKGREAMGVGGGGAQTNS